MTLERDIRWCHVRLVHDDEAVYGIDELADRAGVSRRTVRYYVQRGLLPAPTSVGRGKHYKEEHLSRLVRIRELQEEGVALVDIAMRLDGAAKVVQREDALPVQSTWTRIALSRDVELMVRGRRLEDAVMRRLIAAVEKTLGEDES
jgi:DNA-binding transcriptional MerR regulator